MEDDFLGGSLLTLVFTRQKLSPSIPYILHNRESVAEEENAEEDDTYRDKRWRRRMISQTNHRF